MSWQDQNGKDPWNKGNRGDKKPEDDLEKMAKELQDKLKNFFGGGKGKGKDNGSGQSSSGGLPQLGGLIALVLLGWAATGFYKIDQSQNGVVKRFGEYVRVTDPGLHWHAPVPIETVTKVNVAENRQTSFTKIMLTQDENIVDIDLNVQFVVSDPIKFLFNVRTPEQTLKEVSQSAIREIVGKHKLDYIITDGRTDVASTTRDKIQETLNSYDVGIRVLTVNLVDANFPAEVNDAVQDAIRAREDKETSIFVAQTYANDIVPKARGEAGKRLEDANAYEAQEIANADGEASRFDQLLVEYEKAPEVTRKRLYLETIEEVFGRTGKVIMDSEGSGNLIYLPVDQLIKQNKPTATENSDLSDNTHRAAQPVTSSTSRERPSTRGDR